MSVIKIEGVVLVDTDKLIPNPDNTNDHPKDQIDHLAKQYAYTGMRTPIIVSKQSGLIVAGHGRWLAAKKAKLKQVPVSYQDFETPAHEFAFSVADNATADWATLNLGKINLQLPQFGPELPVPMLGIKDFELEPADKYADKDADEIPEEVEPICKLGQIWKLGEHRLMCGDSTDEQQVALLMDGEKADFVYMDPPYGMNLNTNYAITSSVVGKTYKPVIGDDQDFDPRFFFELFKEAREHFWWGADYYCQCLPKGGSWVVWDKKKDDLDESIGTGYELCWSMVPHKRMMARFLWSGFTAKEKSENRVHPTQKPISLHEWFFARWGKDKDKVVDLFGGSGSTLIACEKTNRKCFMMELDPHYCDVIIARWEKFTGKKAELLSPL